MGLVEFGFSQTQLVEGKIAPALVLPHEVRQALPFSELKNFIKSIKSDHN